jgi:6-phosphogluconolactonase
MTGRGTDEVEVLPGADALMETAAERLVGRASAAIRASGRFVLALAGGSTPRGLYQLLASPRHAQRIEWAHVHVFWGDERCVPPDDPASNYRMAREALLDRVPVPPSNVHRIHAEDRPAAAAAAYEEDLRRVFSTPDGPPREAPGACFDLILLGMGDNGHTASLFPGLTAVRESRRWVLAEYVSEVSMWRVTLTPPVINAAADVLFVVSGSAKAPMLHQVLEGPRRPDALPAQAIVPRAGATWLVDAAAGADLRRPRAALT